jgi:hypothetical protein
MPPERNQLSPPPPQNWWIQPQAAKLEAFFGPVTARMICRKDLHYASYHTHTHNQQ